MSTHLRARRGTVLPTGWRGRVRRFAAQERHHHLHSRLCAVHVVLLTLGGNVATLVSGHSDLTPTRQTHEGRSPLETHVVWEPIYGTRPRVIGVSVGTWAALEDVCWHLFILYYLLFHVFEFFATFELWVVTIIRFWDGCTAFFQVIPGCPRARPMLSELFHGTFGFCPRSQRLNSTYGACFCSDSGDRCTSLLHIKAQRRAW